MMAAIPGALECSAPDDTFPCGIQRDRWAVALCQEHRYPECPTPMKLFCSLTPSHELLFHSYFRPTLPAGFDLQIIRSSGAGQGDFLSADWSQAVMEKGQAICQSLRENHGEVIVWSDVDVQFLALQTADLSALLTQSGREILFQREWREAEEANAGFFVCRSTAAVIALFDGVLEDMAGLDVPRNQPAINTRLQHPQPAVAWGYLPLSFYARTHGWPPPADLALHHANGTVGKNTVARKIAQFEEVRAFIAAR